MANKQAAQAKPLTPVPTPAAAKPAAVPSTQEFARLIGEVSWLMSRSPNHKFAFMADLEWLVMPPLALGQARLYRNDKGEPIAYVSWALVSDAVNERLKSSVSKLQPPEWRSGTHPWVIDVVAPFGGVNEALEAVQKSVFEGRVVPILSQRQSV